MSPDRLKPHSVFLWLALVFGIAVMLANPPYEAPDEPEHFLRVFQLSEGTLFAQRQGGTAGGVLPQMILNVTATNGIPFHPENKMKWDYFAAKAHPAFVRWDGAVPRTFVAFPHAVMYPPIGYIPQALGVFIGRLLRIGPLGLTYLARLSGFIASVVLGYAALRLLPVYRWTAMLFLLCPMSLYLMGSIGSDGLIITSSYLLVSLAVRIGTDPDHRVTAGEKACLLALITIPSVAKIVYAPFAATVLVFVIPRLRSWREKAAFGAACAALCLVPALIWYHSVASLYVKGRADIPLDPAFQWHYMAGSPLAFLSLVAHTLKVTYPGTCRWFVGVLGWGDTSLPGWFYTLFWIGILACLILESRRASSIRWTQRFTMLATAAIMVVLICAVQYAMWNPPGSRAPIDGVQGRYFLPLAPLAVLSFPLIPRLRCPDAWAANLGTLLGFASAAVCLEAVIARYYFP